MKCEDCNGSGYIPKHKNCYHAPGYEQWINGCNEEKRCSRCKGTGTTGAELVRAMLLEIKLESTDSCSVKLAERALLEYENIKITNTT